MMRLQYEKAPPKFAPRGHPFHVSVVLVNENGLPPGHLPAPPVLTVSLRTEAGDEIKGNPILAVAPKGGWSPHAEEGAARNTAKMKMTRSATLDLECIILSRCNGQHYSGSQHTDECMHTIKRPLQLVMTAVMQVAAPAASVAAAAPKGKEEEKKGKGGKGRNDSKNDKGKGAKSASGQGGGSVTVEAMGLLSFVEVGKAGSNGDCAAALEQEEEEEGDEVAGDHFGRAYKTGGGCRLIPCAGGHVIVEEWPKFTRQCTGAIVWDNAWLMIRHLEGMGRRNMHKKTMVDLGCGTGVVGICAGVLGANVLLTDMDHALDLPRRNQARNLQAIKAGGGKVESAVHVWGSDVAPLLASLGGKQAQQPVDFVVACEVVYQPESYPSLVKSISDLSGPKTVVLLAVRRRHNTEVDSFLEMMKEAGFSLDRQDGWVGGLGAASLVGTDVTRVKEHPDFFACRLQGAKSGKKK